LAPRRAFLEGRTRGDIGGERDEGKKRGKSSGFPRTGDWLVDPFSFLENVLASRPIHRDLGKNSTTVEADRPTDRPPTEP
jgi:hypothetical protein